MANTAAQMNIRLDSQVKASGDAVLAKLGTTPTEFVRAVWEKLATDGEERRKLEELVFGREEKSQADDPRIEALARARQHYQQGMARLAIATDPSASTEQQTGTDEELYLDALLSRMRERRTW